jgi:DNA-binding HxlR family transcriptional regulator
MRSYSQYCSIARALDVVGERWSMLIFRELLLQGPCRFTDVKNGLPGIATNLLSSRLKELEDAGLIRREDAPPPVASTLYILTPTGAALEPVLKSLAAWGLQFMVDEREDDAFQSQWLGYPASWFMADAGPSGPLVVIQLVSGDQAAFVEIGGGAVRSRVGRAPRSDLELQGPPRSILGLLTGVIDFDQATQLGLVSKGDIGALARLQPVGDGAPAASTASASV